MAIEKRYSFQTGYKNTFGVADYVIFAATLGVSAGIGIFYAIKDRKKKNTKDFLMAGGDMHLIPVAMSLLATFMSAITLLGTPAEMYNYTTIYLWMCIGYLLAIAVSAHIYLPVFYRLKVTSAYEYLERRFSPGVRLLGTGVFCLQMMIYMSIVIYGPSMAMNAVTGLSLWGSVAAIGGICTFYTTLGGMKAVLWTDTFQVFMMIAGILAALIQGCIEIGGFSEAWRIAGESGRVEWSDFRPDPTIRHGFWSLTIGSAFVWTSVYGTNQAQIQRALTIGKLRDAQIAMWLNVPGLWVILILCSLVGIVMYAFYSTCDPLQFGLVFANDQLFPLFVMDVLGHIPGLPGLFVASIFSGSLSTMSSGLNSMAAVLLQDVLRPYCLKGMSESRAKLWSRIIAVVLGIVCLLLTVVASKLGGILQAALSLFGMLGGPLMGLFTLGMLFPWANKWGAYAGMLTSLTVMFWIGVGTYLHAPPQVQSVKRIHGCNWTLVDDDMTPAPSLLTTFSPANFTTAFPEPRTRATLSGIERVYEVSYLWYTLIAIVVVNVVGLIVSFATGRQDPKDIDPRLIRPICSVICPCCPTVHCGVQHHKADEWAEREQLEKDGELDPAPGHRLVPDVGVALYEKNGVAFEAETVKLRPKHP